MAAALSALLLLVGLPSSLAATGDPICNSKARVVYNLDSSDGCGNASLASCPSVCVTAYNDAFAACPADTSFVPPGGSLMAFQGFELIQEANSLSTVCEQTLVVDMFTSGNYTANCNDAAGAVATTFEWCANGSTTTCSSACTTVFDALNTHCDSNHPIEVDTNVQLPVSVALQSVISDQVVNAECRAYLETCNFNGLACNTTHAPTSAPTEAPTAAPTSAPTPAPPTDAPTSAPTASPTPAPPTDAPTSAPTASPTPVPPTDAPTSAPTAAPTDAPTDAPTPAPTGEPTAAPTAAPTDAPTDAPSSAPSPAPTAAPPTEAPTSAPTAPTEAPTAAPPSTTADGGDATTEATVPTAAPTSAEVSSALQARCLAAWAGVCLVAAGASER